MSRSRKSIFVGYLRGKKRWKLYDFETSEYFVSRDVKFYETGFPFPRNTPSTSSFPTNIVAPNFDYTNDSFNDLLYIGRSGSDNDVRVVQESVIITNPTTKDGVASTNNDDVWTTSDTGHEMGSGEVEANVPNNNVAPSSGSIVP